jgi:3',5'-cyclic AMP phosphodiesterase CpdA
VGARLAWPLAALAGKEPEVRLALLADAHLVDGEERRAEARALARAVAEIRALQPAPDLVLFAGDLAHRADPRALALGQEILSDLPAPLLMVMGEGDGLPDGAGPWRRLFGEPRFTRILPQSANRQTQTVLQVVGLHTAWCPGPGGPGFYVGAAGRGWLARELARLDPDQPLLVLSHAPLAQLFHPWQQWTGDAPQVAELLAPFRHVHCWHGHVHRPGVGGQGAGARVDSNHSFSRELSEPQTPNQSCHYGLPATAWPRPDALQGTPAALRPGLGPQGCGWSLILRRGGVWRLSPQIWQI